MSGYTCFICQEPNYNGNETVINVQRRKFDHEKGTQSTLTWKGMICDCCMRKYFEPLAKEVDR